MHRYLMMKLAMALGSFVFMSYVQEITLMRPSLPTLIQFGFTLFWLANVLFTLFDNFFLIFLLMMAVGGL